MILANNEARSGTKDAKPSRGMNFKETVADQVSFLGTVFRAPRAVGAIAPTSSETGRVIASHVDLESDLPVLELGAGTGPITKALLDRGLAPERLIAVEFSPPLCRGLEKKFPKVRVIEGDAFEIGKTLRDAMGDDAPKMFDTVVSGLPLLNFPVPMRRKLLEAGLSMVPPGRPFVQFSYGFVPPVKVDHDPSISLSRSRWVLKNFPPARVWVYTRNA